MSDMLKCHREGHLDQIEDLKLKLHTAEQTLMELAKLHTLGYSNLIKATLTFIRTPITENVPPHDNSNNPCGAV